MQHFYAANLISNALAIELKYRLHYSDSGTVKITEFSPESDLFKIIFSKLDDDNTVLGEYDIHIHIDYSNMICANIIVSKEGTHPRMHRGYSIDWKEFNPKHIADYIIKEIEY